MRIAFLVLAHKNPGQLCRLIGLLLRYEGATVLVHVDLGSPEAFQRIRADYEAEPRVVVLRDRYRVHRGSFAQILATAALIEAATQLDGIDYGCLISGQDLPIKPISSFASYLEAHQGQEFLQYFELPSERWTGGGLHRMHYYHFDIEGHPYRTQVLNERIARLQDRLHYKRRLRGRYYGGSNWFTLTGRALSYVCDTLRRDRRFLAQFKHTHCADEIFVQTILVNSSFRDSIIPDDLHYIDWTSGPEYPRVFRTEDVPRLLASQDKFLARKFDEAIDADAIAKVTEALGHVPA